MASTVSIANDSSAGAAGGSVIDVSTLVSQLVTAAQSPQQSIITQQTTAVTTQISAVGTLKSALSTFQSALSSLDSISNFNTQVATTSNVSAFTATADSDAALGSYDVQITQLAKAAQLRTNTQFTTASDGSVATGSTTLSDGTNDAAGTLTVSLGDTSFNITVDSSNNTLSGIAAAINSASGNPGITASVLQGSDGPHLLLTSAQTGASNDIGISVDETDGGTSLAGLDTTTASNYTTLTPAQDAEFSVAGVDFTSSGNTVDDAVKGVTFTLLKGGTTDTTTGTTTPATGTLTVSTDTSTIEDNIKAFVDAYNTLQQTFTSLGGYDSTTGTAGSMMGSALLDGVKNSINGITHGLVSDTGSSLYSSLASIGITSNKDGSLSINQTKLDTALSSNYSAVEQMFAGTSGIATQLNSRLTDVLGADGSIATKSASLVKQENALDDRTTQLQTQMDALSASLTTQFTALNTLLSSLQSTSSYLSQAFATLPSMNNYNKN